MTATPECVMIIQWNDSFKTHVAEIDAQHETLVEKLNAFHQSIELGSAEREVGEFLSFLWAYAFWHFEKEEACMQAHQCQALEINRRAHNAFLEICAGFQAQLNTDGPSIALAEALQRRATNWVVNHILRVDTHLRDCARTNP